MRQGSKSRVFFPRTDNHRVGDIIPRGAPLRTEHSKKNTTVHGIGCSLHLNISYTYNIRRMQFFAFSSKIAFLIQEQLLNIPKNTTVHGMSCSLHLNISYTCNIQRMQNVCLSYENCPFDPGTIIFAPRTFCCFRDKFLFYN